MVKTNPCRGCEVLAWTFKKHQCILLFQHEFP